jgi:2-polyprenyl-3-methyl-5-hydroxy-6-metoxy-1,4-benzoquinol methylase
MKKIDIFLQKWRLRVGLKKLGENLRVIDVGAHQGECFHALGAKLKYGFGIEPLAKNTIKSSNFEIKPGFFPEVLPSDKNWDVITMFAVMEHIPREQFADLADACYILLREGGQIIITVPSPKVDYILSILRAFRLIDGMSLEEHFGFEVEETIGVFSVPRFKLVRREVFQLGLNHLFVFEKQA